MARGDEIALTVRVVEAVCHFLDGRRGEVTLEGGEKVRLDAAGSPMWRAGGVPFSTS